MHCMAGWNAEGWDRGNSSIAHNATPVAVGIELVVMPKTQTLESGTVASMPQREHC